MKDTPPTVPNGARLTTPVPPILAPNLMMVFWVLLGGAAGIKLTESIWRFRGAESGELTMAVSVGAGVGARAGALLGLIQNPHALVLLMAIFAGASAGGVAGELPGGMSDKSVANSPVAWLVGSPGRSGCWSDVARSHGFESLLDRGDRFAGSEWPSRPARPRRNGSNVASFTVSNTSLPLIEKSGPSDVQHKLRRRGL